MELKPGTKVYFRVHDKSEQGRVLKCKVIEYPSIICYKEGNYSCTVNICPINENEVTENNFDHFWDVPINQLYKEKSFC